MDHEIEERIIVHEAIGTATARLASGKGHVPCEQRNDLVERQICEELTERARAGDHFPSSLPTHLEDLLL